jgi:hypothetical protein
VAQKWIVSDAKQLLSPAFVTVSSSSDSSSSRSSSRSSSSSSSSSSVHTNINPVYCITLSLTSSRSRTSYAIAASASASISTAVIGTASGTNNSVVTVASDWEVDIANFGELAIAKPIEWKLDKRLVPNQRLIAFHRRHAVNTHNLNFNSCDRSVRSSTRSSVTI